MAVLTEEQNMLRDAARSWVQEKSPVTAFRKMRDSGAELGYDVAAWNEMAEMGWAGVIIPEEYGGSAFGYLSMGLILEETGRTLTASPLLASALGAASALVLGGSEEQKQAWLPKIAAGEVVATLAIDEGPHHKPEKVDTTVEGGKLTGKKTFVLEGMAADLLVVSARGADGVGLYLVKAVLVRYPHLVFAKGVPSTVLADGHDDDDDTTATYTDLLDGGEEMLQLTTPRTIDAMSRWLNAVDPVKLSEYLQTQITTQDGRDTTMLNEIVEAHVGNTEFATHLVAEIASGLNSGAAAQVQQLTAPKPNCFNSLKQAATVNDLEAIISSLTEHEKSGSLLYALYEHADNRIIIEQLAQQVAAIEPDHNRLLVQLAAASMLDDENLSVLFGTSTSVGDTTRLVLSSFMA